MTIHIVGAGLAGLGAAIALRDLGPDLALYEAAPQAGGRCRSWFDPVLDATIDNGTHVIMGANHEVTRFTAAIGAADELHWVDAGVAFHDLGDDARWTIRTAADVLRLRRLWGDTLGREAVSALRLGLAPSDAAIEACLAPRSRLAHRFWRPLARAVMNTDPTVASAGPFARVLRQTLARGPAAMRVGIARRSLSASFVDPALEILRRAGVSIRMSARLRGVEWTDDRLTKLQFGAQDVAIEARDRVILALAPWDLAHCLPELAPEFETSAIVNLHARVPMVRAAQAPQLIGIIGGTVEWVVARGQVISATVSAADGLARQEAPALAELLWRDVARALELPGETPQQLRIVKEHRATPRQTPAFERLRRGAITRFTNLWLAGDWVEAGLPCTLEAAIGSGARAAALSRRTN